MRVAIDWEARLPRVGVLDHHAGVVAHLDGGNVETREGFRQGAGAIDHAGLRVEQQHLATLQATQAPARVGRQTHVLDTDLDAELPRDV